MNGTETKELIVTEVIPIELIERRIYLIRGQKVMLDADLADLYEVPTKALNQAVRRNSERFPADFRFQLTDEEAEVLRSQIVTSNGRGGRRYLPYVFTEHGVAMLSSVLGSPRAIQMNILIVRAFIRLRDMLATHKDLAQKIAELEAEQRRYGEQFETVYAILNELIAPAVSSKRAIGFQTS